MMITTTAYAETTDRSHVASVLGRLIVHLDAGSGSDTLRPLVRECDEIIEEMIDASRGCEHEPTLPTGPELAWLANQVLTAELQETMGVLRQIRHVLGRLDALLRIGCAAEADRIP